MHGSRRRRKWRTREMRKINWLRKMIALRELIGHFQFSLVHDSLCGTNAVDDFWVDPGSDKLFWIRLNSFDDSIFHNLFSSILFTPWANQWNVIGALPTHIEILWVNPDTASGNFELKLLLNRTLCHTVYSFTTPIFSKRLTHCRKSRNK